MKSRIFFLQGLALAFSGLFFSQSQALDISPIPLQAGGGAKPNVFFIIDDSSSMFGAVMKSREAINMPQLHILYSTATTQMILIS